MSLSLVVFVFLLLTVVSLLAFGLFFYLACRWWKLQRATFRRILVTFLVLSTINLIGAGAYYYAKLVLKYDELLLDLIFVPVLLFLTWMCIVKFLSAGAGRAVLVMLTTNIPTYAVSFALAMLLRLTLLEAFIVPTGGMAPTIYGVHADVTCENCRFEYAVSMSDVLHYRIDRFQPAEKTVACPLCGRESSVAAGKVEENGDRILVDKTSVPRRWDLVVFRFPRNPKQNYIKRLVGLPGETVAIAGGDLFVDGQRLEKPPGKQRDLWLLVHDTAYVAGKKTPPAGWQPEKSDDLWRQSAGGAWSFDGIGGNLRFTSEIRDLLTYNSGKLPDHFPDPVGPTVGDVMVTCQIGEFSGEGSLTLHWEYQDHNVTANIANDGQVDISAVPAKADTAAIEELDNGRGRFLTGLSDVGSFSFAVRDGVAYVTCGEDITAILRVGPRDFKSAAALAIDPKPCRLQISAKNCSVTLARVIVHRDVYYRNAREMGMASGGPDEFADRVDLKADQYWTLGDNSINSHDSRFWGPISADHLIGAARWIYWPRRRWREFQ